MTVSAPKLLPSDLYGHARVTGTDTTIWGAPWLALYGTPEAPELSAHRPLAGRVDFHPARDDLVRFARKAGPGHADLGG